MDVRTGRLGGGGGECRCSSTVRLPAGGHCVVISSELELHVFIDFFLIKQFIAASPANRTCQGLRVTPWDTSASSQ